MKKFLISQFSILNSSGFTLVELITVITIIAILSGIGLTSFRGVQSRGRDSTRKQELRQLSVALELYRQSFGNYYITDEAACSDSNSTTFYSAIGPSMSGGNVPSDPLTQNGKYCYYSENSGKSFRLFAKLENCSDPEVIDPPSCLPSNWNFSVTSADLTISLGPTSGPSPTSGPTSSPTPIPTLAPTATPTPSPLSKFVFVTSIGYNGNLGGLSGADQKCKTLADASSVTEVAGKTWKAWLSSSTIAVNSMARAFTQSTVPYKLVDGTTTIASNWADLTDGSVLAKINRDETGALIPNADIVNANFVWTNTSNTGAISDINSDRACNDWTNSTGIYNNPMEYIRMYCDAFYASLLAIQTNNYACSSLYRLYCFEQ